MLKDVLAICSLPIFFITSATLTSPALEEISVLSFDSVAFEPQAPNKSALAVTGTIILFINFIS